MNKKMFSFICAIVTSILWGSAFVAQDMGMDFIGPYTFSVGRFFVGFLSLVPFFFIFEFNKIKKKDINNVSQFYVYRGKGFFILLNNLISILYF